MIKVNNISNWILPPEAFNWIYENIEEGSTILELGSGFGSIALSLNYKIHSVEQDENWIGLSNRVNYTLAKIKYDFYDRDVLRNSIPKKYDLLILDGPTKASGGRLGFLNNLDLFYLNCPILIDDVHREDEMKLLSSLSKKLNREYLIFDSGNKKFAVI
jgi:hypothetical protein